MPAPRFVRVAAALVSGVLVTAVASSPAEAATVSIKSFSVSPAKIGAAGGKITFKARTSGATSCTLTSSVTLKGLPAAVACASGSATKTIRFPGKVSTTNKSVVFTLTAREGSLATTAKVTVTRLATAPTISTIATAVLVGSGSTDSLHVRATVKYAKTCTLSVSPAVVGLPNTASCAEGEYFRASSIPKNHASTAKVFTVKVSATSATGVTTSKTTKVSQRSSSAALPTINQYGITPSALSASGGTYTVTAAVAHSTTCSLRVTPSLPSQPAPVSCTSGSYEEQLTVPANTTGNAQRFTFVFTAANASASASATITTTQPAAAPAPPMISGFSSTPTTFPAAGTTATISASIANGSTCTLTSSPPLTGLSSTPFACTDTSLSRTVTVPANSGAAQSYTFTLRATGPAGGTATATLGVGQDAGTPPPSATLSLSPTSVSASGGNYSVNATLTNASTCALSSSPSLGISTTAVDCSSGSFTRAITITANTGAARSYTLTLNVTGPGGTATGSLTINQPAPAASVTMFSANPGTVGASGGTVTFTGSVANASSCTFTPPSSIGSATTTSCSNGSTKNTASIPPNNSGADRSLTFTLTATGPGGSATGTITLAQSTQPVTVGSTTISPTTVNYTGGQFTLGATVANATSCVWSSTPGADISSTPFTCAGQISTVLTLPANTTTSAKSYTATLTVNGPGGPVSAQYPFTVPAAPPTLTDFKVTPQAIPAAGLSNLTISGTVGNASTCTFTASPTSLLGDPDVQSCSNGSVSSSGAIPPNKTGVSRQLTFTLKVDGPGGPLSQSTTITQPSS